MNTKRNSREGFDELLFENRNKNYGAYALRKEYQTNVSKALLISLGFFCMLAIWGIWSSNHKMEIPLVFDSNDPGILISIKEMDVTPPVEKPKEPVAPPKENPAPRSESGTLVVKDNSNPDPVRTNDQQTISKNPNPTGIVDSTYHEPVIHVVKPPAEPPALVKVPDQMPTFENLNKKIKDNLRYPQIAVEAGTQGTVYLSFIVETDGSVSNIEVLKPIGDGCEQEAVRVVKLLQPWQPGIKDGKAVRVPCTLPIRFVLK